MTDVHALLSGAAQQVRVPPLDVAMLQRVARRRRARRWSALAGAVALVAAAPIAVLLAAGSPTGPQDRLAQPAPPAASAVPSAGPSSPPATVEVSPRLLRVVQIDGNWLGESTAAFGRRSVVAGKDITFTSYPSTEGFWSIAVAFEPLGVPRGRCVQSAVLTMPAASGGGGGGELRAYPSAALYLAAGRVPPNGDRPNALLDNRPSGLETVQPNGRRSYDVTEIIRLWTDGGPFPSEDRLVPKGSPIVMLVRPPGQDAGTYRHSFDVAASPPVLQTRLAAGCLPG